MLHEWWWDTVHDWGILALTDRPGHWGLLTRHGGPMGVAAGSGCRATAPWWIWRGWTQSSNMCKCYTSHTIILYQNHIISYHIISTVLYWFFMFFSLLWGLFSKSSRYCELHWLRCRAHQWMPRFRWRLDYLPSNWGRELRTLWIWDTMVTVCYARSRQVGQLSKTPWVAWLMICSCVKKRKSCMILAALKKVTAPTDCQSQLRGTPEWVSWNKSLHNWACPNPPRGDFRSVESYRFFGTL